jgi:hypothetical protein
MTENQELPCIEYKKHSTQMDGGSEIYIMVKGQSLEDCKKVFDELLNPRKA